MISYDELLQKYKLLEQENKILKAQIAELQKEKSGVIRSSENKTSDFTDSLVIMQSTPSEKIHLFRDLFRGREDVFARRWYSTTTQKAAINRYAATNGKTACAIKENINAQSVPTANCCP